MPQPTPPLDDDALVAEILARVPDAVSERRVRSLLAAWWRYAGVRNAAGAVVDSDTFIAERGALGLLELPPSIAGRVIELEFALLHDPATPGQPVPAPAPAPEPVPLRVLPTPTPTAPPAVVAPPPRVQAAPPPAPVAAPPVQTPPPVAAIPAPVAAPPRPAERLSLAKAEVVDVEVLQLDDEPLPISAFEAFQDVRERRDRTRDDAQTAVMAGFVVFFSIVVGLALVLGQRVDHLTLPGGASEPLVAGWRAFLAIFTGFGGALIGLVAATRLHDRRGALLLPASGLLGLGVLGLGLLSGSVVFVGVGAAAFALGGLVAFLRR